MPVAARSRSALEWHSWARHSAPRLLLLAQRIGPRNGQTRRIVSCIVFGVRRLRVAAPLATSALMLLMTACGGGSSSGGSQKAQRQVNALKVDSQRWLGNWPAVSASTVRESPCVDSGPGYIQVDLAEQIPSGHSLDDLPARLRADGWSVQGTVAQLRGAKHMAEGFEAGLVTERVGGGVEATISIPDQLCGS